MSNSSREIVYPISSRSTAGCTPHGRYENNETHTMRTILDNPFLRYLAVTLLCFSLVMVTGCSGCSDKEDSKAAKKEKDKKKKKKKKKDYESRRAVILPGYYPKPKTEEEIEAEKKDPELAAENALTRPNVTKNKTKLGHWVTTNFQAIANNFNAEGQLTTYSQTGTSSPVAIPSTDYYISSSRPVSLPKGEWKNFETTVFLPTRSVRTRSANINYQVSRNASGLPMIQNFDGAPLMKPHQFHLLIMSSRPDTYKFLEFADSIKLSGSTLTGGKIPAFYLIVPSIPGDPLPLPQHALTWTSIAYLIWDDYDPDQLQPEHQQAILDWIHFGGQLIVSGPDSLDKLQNSFLGQYLPAQFEKSRNLNNTDVAELNKNWTVKLSRNPAEVRELKISDSVPLLGVDFKPHEDANFVDGTGGIAIERTLGRGRIVVTAFSLNAPTIRKWRSFKSFFNGALLRKPARNFGRVKGDFEAVAFEWVDDATSLFDPLVGSTLRFLSRDLSRSGTEKSISVNSGVAGEYDAPQNPGGFGGGFGYQYYDENPHLKINRPKNSGSGIQRNLDNHRYYGGFQNTPQSGVAGWNDRSGISQAARNTLKLAAGIRPPSSSFVLKMLAAYLVVLVPLNWLIFRMIGRVEYAWIAAPLIAIAGAFLVIRFASLDIGFISSNTQVGVLEIQADYSRAHLAEYSALYTSFSTPYSAELDNLTAQSLPFAIDDDPANYKPKDKLSQVQLRRTVKNRLEGFQIQSNTTGLVHTEYLLDLKGIISFIPPEPDDPESGLVTNSTNIDISNAGVVGRTEDGDYQVAWLGDLAAGAESELSFAETSLKKLKGPWVKIPVFSNTKRAAAAIWENNLPKVDAAILDEIRLFPELEGQWPEYQRLFIKDNGRDSQGNETFTKQEFEEVFQSVNSSTEISVGRMFDAVIENLTIAPGEYRLIGSSSQRLGRTKFEPDSTQVEQQTLVVVHLQYPKLPLAKPDLNSFEEFKSARSNLSVEDEQQALEDALEELIEVE